MTKPSSRRALAKPKRSTLRDRAVPKILRRLEAGEGMNSICKSAGMPDRETVRRWCTADPALAERIMEARETGFLDRAERAVEAAKSATDAQLGRLAFDAERWYLGKLSNAFAERPPKVDNQTNVQVNLNADSAFGRIVEILDGAAAAISSSASRTDRVADEGAAGPNSA